MELDDVLPLPGGRSVRRIAVPGALRRAKQLPMQDVRRRGYNGFSVGA
jgi:hypothetical protein